MEKMTVEKIFGLGLINDDTKVWIRGEHVLAAGNWYQDDILAYLHHEAASFTWLDNGDFYIDVKEYKVRFWEDKKEDSRLFETMEEAEQFYAAMDGKAVIQKWNPEKRVYDDVVFPEFEF